MQLKLHSDHAPIRYLLLEPKARSNLKDVALYTANDVVPQTWNFAVSSNNTVANMVLKLGGSCLMLKGWSTEIRNSTRKTKIELLANI